MIQYLKLEGNLKFHVQDRYLIKGTDKPIPIATPKSLLLKKEILLSTYGLIVITSIGEKKDTVTGSFQSLIKTERGSNFLTNHSRDKG